MAATILLWKEPCFPAFVRFCVTFDANLRKPSGQNRAAFSGDKRPSGTVTAALARYSAGLPKR